MRRTFLFCHECTDFLQLPKAAAYENTAVTGAVIRGHKKAPDIMSEALIIVVPINNKSNGALS